MEGRPLSTTTTRAKRAPTNWAERAEKAHKLALAAHRKAARVGSDEAVNRSTRQRNVMRAKADAFDQIALVLAGKDA
jgi:hypothetical protein